MLSGIPVKYLSLLTLVVQNSALILLMRYTRASADEGHLYLASTAVVMSEIVKMISCVFILYFAVESHKRSIQKLVTLLNRELILKWRETAKLALPATLYLIQNNLQYVAASNLDAATFQVTYQLKILTTAFFSVVVLNKSLSKLKWISLAILTVGIALVVLPKGASTAFIAYITANSIVSETEEPENMVVGNQSKLRGFLAVLAACMLSGLAGVYFEKILKATPSPNKLVSVNNDNEKEVESKKYVNVQYKDEDADDEEASESAKNQIWIRNIQMSFFSVLLGLVFVVALQDGVTIAQRGFFVNYTFLTWVVIGIQAVGGLVVALVVTYADNILKGFATSISIILSSVVSVWLFNFSMSSSFLMGAVLVIYATYLYGL